MSEPCGETEQHHGDRRHRVRLEQVGRHPGAVADVVADVVRDHGRVARVVLGDARLDLPDQIGADVGGLCVDAAAEPGEDRDQGAAEGEADQVVDRRVRRAVEPVGQHGVVAGDAEKAETHDEHACHRACAERDVQRRGEPLPGRLRGADVRAHGDVHADEAGGRGEDGSDQEADRGSPAELVVEADQQEGHQRHPGDRRVLAAEVCGRAFLDRLRDFAHPFVARGLAEQPGRQVNAVRHGHAGADEPDEHGVMHEPIHPFPSVTKSLAEGLRRGQLCITSPPWSGSVLSLP